MELYVKIDNTWPSIKKINGRVIHFMTEYHFKNHFSFLMEQFYEVSDYQKKIYCFVMLETIRWNREILDKCYDDDIYELLEHITPYPELNKYVNDLKRSCLLDEREEAINRVKCFYFKHVEGLCPDIVEKIINLLLPVVVDKIITH
jgi:hypothetical protein